MNLREVAGRVGLGKLALAMYHRPLGRIRQSLRNGGPFAERETERQRREMEMAAHTIPELPNSAASQTPTVHLMTGRRFWFQTAFCLHSLAWASGTEIRAELYDDGTIDGACRAQLARLGPAVRIHTAAELHSKLETQLPIERYPTLRERWVNYPNIRKLIDVHLGSSGWKLVIDSDLLFFRRPDAVLAWLSAPQTLLHAVDCTESYGYSRPLLEKLAGAPMPVRLNVGLCGLQSNAIDWEQLEYWTGVLHREERTNYYLEQALVAMLAARQTCAVLSADDYVTGPTKSEAMHPQAVMHHYVDTTKRWYFRYGWKHIRVSPFDAKAGGA